MRAKSLKLFAGVLCSMLAASTYAGPAWAQATGALKKVSVVAVAPTSLFWPLFIAQEKGFFRDKGLDVAVTFAGSASGPMQMLIPGEFDFAITTTDIGVDAAGHGAKIKLIAGYMSSRPFLIMARPGIATAADLKGKAVGLPPPRDINTVVWGQWLRAQGIKPGEVDQIYNGDTASRFAALSNGATAAAMLSPPVSFRAQKNGFTPLLDLGEYMRGVPFLSIFARADWVDSHADVTRAFLQTQSAAIDWFYDEANREQAIQILARHIKMERPLLEETYDYYFKNLKPFSRKLAVSSEGLAKEIADMVETGTVKSTAAVPASFHDPRFLPQ